TRQFFPRLTSVSRAKQRRIFNARVDRVWIVERRFKMPYAFELPRVWSTVVKLVGRERFAGLSRRVVNKLVALAHRHSFGRGGWRARGRSGLKPRLAAVVRALNDLSKPAAGLRCVNPVGIDGRAFWVVELPAGEVGATNVPFFSFTV